MKGGFCQLQQNNQTHRSVFFNIRSQRKSRSSEQILEGRKQHGNFESKGRKFYIITCLTFLRQHFDQERVSFSKVKHGSACKLNLWLRSIFEGFGGKRALGILRKIELCQKRSKFRMQFLFRCLKQCSACFFPEACFLLEILRMRKNTFFRGHPLGTFCWMKNKRTFCFAKRWSHYNTLIIYYCFVSASG